MATKSPKKPKGPSVVKTAPQNQGHRPPHEVAPQGSHEAYEQFLPAALALAPSVVTPFKGDPTIVHANVRTGVSNVMAQKAQILEQLPAENLTVFMSLPSKSLALIFAALQARRGAGADGELQAELAEARKLRRLMLTSMQALAEVGVFSDADVRAVRAGHGAVDTASDLIDLAAKFKAKASATHGKSPVTAAHIARAGALGSKLQGKLSPGGAKKKGPPLAAAKATDLRDRFGVLVSQAHDRLWRVGALLFGRSVDHKVPSLLSHGGHRTMETRAAKAQRAATKATAKAQKAVDRAARVKGKKGG